MKKTIGVLTAFALFFGMLLFFDREHTQISIDEIPTNSDIAKSSNDDGKLDENKDKPKVETKDSNSDEASSMDEEIAESCKNFRSSHPQQEQAFNEIINEIHLSSEDMTQDSVFSTMDWISLSALANGGDKDALFFLGDGISVKAIFGKDFYGPKEVRHSPSEDEIKQHKVNLAQLAEGEKLLFKAGVRGKLGAFLSMKMNSELAAKKLIRTSKEASSEIKNKLADMLAYNQLLGFIHKADEPFRLMFVDSAKPYNENQLKSHYDKWKPDVSYESFKEELLNLADDKYLKYKSDWIAQREFYGFDVHPKLLSPELEAYLTKVSKLCWN